MTRAYRPGGVGALMDEYERAAGELVRVVEGLSDAEFEALRDPDTSDDDCRSIQTILSHVVRAGFGYAGYIRAAFGAAHEQPKLGLLGREECVVRLGDALAYTAETLDGRWRMGDEEVQAVRIEARWGPVYDLEQMLEHAIVHVMRHRRQVERFLASA
jgi:hypothetical protein